MLSTSVIKYKIIFLPPWRRNKYIWRGGFAIVRVQFLRILIKGIVYAIRERRFLIVSQIIIVITAAARDRTIHRNVRTRAAQVRLIPRHPLAIFSGVILIPKLGIVFATLLSSRTSLHAVFFCAWDSICKTPSIWFLAHILTWLPLEIPSPIRIIHANAFSASLSTVLKHVSPIW